MEIAAGVDIATAFEIVNEIFGQSDIDQRDPSSSLSQLAISSSSLLETVNSTADLTNTDTITTTITADTNTQKPKKESTSSDEAIVIIDEKNTSLTCIDLTELDKDNDDIIIENHIKSTNFSLMSNAISRASRLHNETPTEGLSRATTSSTLVDCFFGPESSEGRVNRSKRRKRSFQQTNGTHDTTIVLDDDLVEPPVVQQRTINAMLKPVTAANLLETSQIQHNKRSRESQKSKPTKQSNGIGLSIQCPICLETLEELKQHGKQLKSTTCGHILCGNCLDNMKSSTSLANKIILCPICRSKLTKAKIHDLFL